MERTIITLERSGWITVGQLAALKATQEKWECYAQGQAAFATAEYEGGSIASLIYSSDLGSRLR